MKKQTDTRSPSVLKAKAKFNFRVNEEPSPKVSEEEEKHNQSYILEGLTVLCKVW